MNLPIPSWRFAAVCCLSVLTAGLSAAQAMWELRWERPSKLLDNPGDAIIGERLDAIAKAPRRWARAIDDEYSFPPSVAELLSEFVLSPGTLQFSLPEDQFEDPKLLYTTPGREGGGRVLRLVENVLRSEGGELGQPDDDGWYYPESDAYALRVTPNVPAEQAIFEAAFGGYEGPVPFSRPSVALPAGTTPLLTMSVDARLIPEMLIDDEQAAEIMRSLSLVGDEAMRLDVVFGHDAEQAVGLGRVERAINFLSPVGIHPDVTFDAALLEQVPASATAAAIVAVDIARANDTLRGALERFPIDRDPYQMVSAILGVDIEADLIDQLGPTFVWYTSTDTGGGGILSSVFIAQAQDEEALWTSLQRTVEFTGGAAGMATRQLISSRGFELENGEPGISLTSPSLPVPIQPCLALVEERVIFALNRAALQQAANFVRGGGRSLADLPHIQQAIRDAGDAPISLQYINGPYWAERSWGLYLLADAAMANFAAVDFDAPDVAPLSREAWVAGAEHQIAVSGWDGDAFVVAYTGDRSFLRSTLAQFELRGGVLGSAWSSPMGGALLFRTMRAARSEARVLVSSSNVRGIVVGAIVYATDNDDRLPENLDELVDLEILSEDMLVSPRGSAWDGTADYAIRGGGRTSEIREPTAYILVIDRAAVINGEEQIPVGFLDGHVETLSSWELVDRLNQDINEGAVEALDIEDWFEWNNWE